MTFSFLLVLLKIWNAVGAAAAAATAPVNIGMKECCGQPESDFEDRAVISRSPCLKTYFPVSCRVFPFVE